MNILTINCEKGYMPGITSFLSKVFKEGKYDFVLLQELQARESPFFDPELKDILGSYSLLRAFNKEVRAWSQIGLAYRKDFILEKSTLFSFPSFGYLDFPRPEFGLLAGTFRTPFQSIVVGSLHLWASINIKARGKELRFAKEKLLGYNDRKLPVIFGGDFNSGLWWEKPRNRGILEPEFLNVTKDLGPTVDSRYVEPTTPLNALARGAAKVLGFHLRMTVDHIYADSKTAASHSFASRILPDRVSDHSPLEVVITSLV